MERYGYPSPPGSGRTEENGNDKANPSTMGLVGLSTEGGSSLYSDWTLALENVAHRHHSEQFISQQSQRAPLKDGYVKIASPEQQVGNDSWTPPATINEKERERDEHHRQTSIDVAQTASLVRPTTVAAPPTTPVKAKSNPSARRGPKHRGQGELQALGDVPLYKVQPIRDTPGNPFLEGGPADLGHNGSRAGRSSRSRASSTMPSRERGTMTYVFRGQRVTYADAYASESDDDDINGHTAEWEDRPVYSLDKLQPKLLFPGTSTKASTVNRTRPTHPFYARGALTEAKAVPPQNGLEHLPPLVRSSSSASSSAASSHSASARSNVNVELLDRLDRAGWSDDDDDDEDEQSDAWRYGRGQGVSRPHSYSYQTTIAASNRLRAAMTQDEDYDAVDDAPCSIQEEANAHDSSSMNCKRKHGEIDDAVQEQESIKREKTNAMRHYAKLQSMTRPSKVIDDEDEEENPFLDHDAVSCAAAKNANGNVRRHDENSSTGLSQVSSMMHQTRMPSHPMKHMRAAVTRGHAHGLAHSMHVPSHIRRMR